MAATGCSGGHFDAKAMSGADLSQGGIQDMLLARDIIEQGGIPGQDHYASEGLFSEHDLAIAGDACGELLCPRASMARVQTVGSSDVRLLAQLGFATDIDLQSFERDSLDLVVAVDISGSMQGEKIGATRAALRALVRQLDVGDRLGIVAFDDRVSVRSELIAVDEAGRQTLLDRIDGIETAGGTWIEGGLREAFEMVDAASSAEGVSKRVMILTDAQPNVGATDSDSFLGMARSYADRDIGLTSFGVGMDLGFELASELAKIRGGNSYTLGSVAEIRTVFDEDFDFMVTPLAYDLEVVVTPSEGLNAEEGYGVAVDPAGDVGFGAATLFLSNKGGGMGIALVPSDADGGSLDDAAVSMSLSFEAAADGERTFDDIEVALSSGEAFQLVEDSEVVHAADDGGVFTMAVLIDELAALDMGAAFCDGEQDAELAATIIRQAADRLESASAQIAEEALQSEAQLMRKLADNVDGGAGNCR
jgi:Ca-activated chloride channel family protein